MTCRSIGFRSRRGGVFGTYVSSALAIAFLFTVLMLDSDSASNEQAITRAPPLPGYSASVDGDGVDGDICLAGYRLYRFTYEFSSSPLGSLTYINISKVNVDPPIISTPLISYSVADDSSVVVGDLEVSVGEHELITNSSHLVSFSVEVLFHLNWSDPQTSINLVPAYLDYGGNRVTLQADDDAPIVIWGMLDRPKVTMVIDEMGNDLSNQDIVRSNSTVRIYGVLFHYWHSTESFSELSPLPGEIIPVVQDEFKSVGPIDGTRYNFSIESPDLSDSKWELTIGVQNVHHPDWPKRVALWVRTMQLDGLGPAFDLKSPTGKVGEGYVEWTVTLNERPSSTANLVNGSTLMVRSGSGDGNWSDWIDAGEPGIGRQVDVQGSSILTLDGDSQIQFMARDMLGNAAESRIYPINLNRPPAIALPEEYKDMRRMTNQSIELDGYDFAVDEDDSRESLIYLWKFDGEIIGRTNTFSKPLFVEAEGTHNISLTVTDGYGGTNSLTFDMLVEEAPAPPEDPAWKTLIKDPLFQVVASSILAILVIVLLSVLIIVVVRRLGKTDSDDDDFVISEDANRSTEDIARKIHGMYSGNFAVVGADGSANAYEDSSGEEFDFDYNLYEILGLENNASEDEIKSAYRKLAGYYHPDRVAHNKEVDALEAREIMVQINKAKEFLMNPERKARYDEHLSELDFSIET
jgi:hypothetical protein